MSFEKAIKKLIQTDPQKLKVYQVKQVNTVARGLVDSSFTNYYQMTFKDAAAEAVYQGDPTHQTII